MSAIFHECSCGAQYATPAEWFQLEYVGTQEFDADKNGPALVLELRNCPACGSTRSVELVPPTGIPRAVAQPLQANTVRS